MSTFSGSSSGKLTDYPHPRKIWHHPWRREGLFEAHLYFYRWRDISTLKIRRK
jgi:hypothetical protein